MLAGLDKYHYCGDLKSVGPTRTHSLPRPILWAFWISPFARTPVLQIICKHRLRGLKELNYVARGVLAENLFAPPHLHNIVSKFHTIVLEP